MLSVVAARETILQHCRPLPAQWQPLSFHSLGRVLAENVASDVDLPPFDKSMMDGYALRSADVPEGKGVLQVVEEITAGRVPQVSLEPGQASRIMTGAPIPAGADAVVMIERTRLVEEGRVAIEDRVPRPGQHILPRAREMARGELILHQGSVLEPQHLGLLAAVGRTSALVIPPASVAVLATGDELVEPPQPPGPGQIRNSNAPMLLAQAARAGASPRSLGIGRDDRASLRPLIEEGLSAADVLILSGGVSAGKLDLVPEVLQEAGMTAHFHKVAMKPGKPLLFGTLERGEKKTLVFGLPGNPISSLVCFELFIRPALRCLAGYSDLDLPPVRARLMDDFHHQSDRPTYHPARLTEAVDGWQVRPLPWFGSADLRGFLEASGLLVLPAGEVQLRGGQMQEVLRLGVGPLTP